MAAARAADRQVEELRCRRAEVQDVPCCIGRDPAVAVLCAVMMTCHRVTCSCFSRSPGLLAPSTNSNKADLGFKVHRSGRECLRGSHRASMMMSRCRQQPCVRNSLPVLSARSSAG